MKYLFAIGRAQTEAMLMLPPGVADGEQVFRFGPAGFVLAGPCWEPSRRFWKESVLDVFAFVRTHCDGEDALVTTAALYKEDAKEVLLFLELSIAAAILGDSL